MDQQGKVKVGVDILDLRYAKTGQKTFLEEVYKQFLVSEHPGVSFVYLDFPLPKFPRKYKLGIIFNHLALQFWKQLVLPLKAYFNQVDVLFCTDYFAPNIRLKFKNVQVLHDAFFYEYPEHYSGLWMHLFKLLAVPAAKNSEYIITPTKYSRNSISKHFNIPLEKIIPIYEGPKRFETIETESPTWIPPNEPYILNVGVWEKRKNIPRLLAAFKALLANINQPIKLVLVGEGSKKMNSDDSAAIMQAITDLQLADHVICTGYLPDHSLKSAYEQALLFIFPSYNEGFGIPILEAFAAEIPVLVANNSCLPEVGANAVISFDPFSIVDMMEKMKIVIENTDLQKDLIKKGKERLLDFSWEQASKEMIEVFIMAAKHGK